MHRVIFVSSDAAMARRLEHALAARCRVIHLRWGEAAPSGGRPELVLWDETAAETIGAAGAAGAEDADTRGGKDWRWLQGLGAPIVRLTAGADVGGGDGEGRRGRAELPAGVVDSVALAAGMGKIVYVVRQRLTAGNLLRLRRAPQPAAAPRRQDLNNLLSCILGNAELALSSAPRLSNDGRQRMEVILSLAQQMRDVLRSERTEADEGRAA